MWSTIKNWLGIHRSLLALKAAMKWNIKEARGTGIQAEAKKLGLASTIYFLSEATQARNLRIFEAKCKLRKKLLERFKSLFLVY